METVIKHCFVKSPKEFSKANNEGDDVYLCEYEYDVQWHTFKRMEDVHDDADVYQYTTTLNVFLLDKV